MKAIFDNKLYYVSETSQALTLETAAGDLFNVEYGDCRLIVDPTDDEVAGADNLAEHYGIDEPAAKELRRMLRGELSIREWEDWKSNRRQNAESR